jgi:tetratricopeptide (TPR) repeat protein
MKGDNMDFDSDVKAGTVKVSSLLRQARELSVHGNEAKARRLFDEALAFAEANGDLLGKGNALKGRGFQDALAGRNAEARQAYDEALALFRQGGHRAQEASMLMGLGHLQERANKSEAKQFFEKAANTFQALGMSEDEDFARAALGRASRERQL